MSGSSERRLQLVIHSSSHHCWRQMLPLAEVFLSIPQVNVQVEFLFVLLRLWCPWQLRQDLFAIKAHKGLAGFALGSNMIAFCSNTTVYVGVTIFALCGPVGVLVGSEATRFLSATGVGIFDRGRERHVPLLRAA